ncbi:MAG: type IV conjugative transfer system protein TraL [SAR324 cluster bacterium]|uniref:Type IV conjugative transfer system protein TraL n=1 Tax=SAR324 cluster bacterium TaxID=2024889 RepID=A0A2A4TC19_9DELT|nr:MAG: type IV conjugative transfer system protein TraL [SAR324 cluster bacterium]
MSIRRKVNFPRYLHKPRVLVAIEMDTVFVFALSFLLTYLSLTFASFPLIIVVFSGFGLATGMTKLYLEFKENTPKGFLWHLVYELGIWKTREDPTKYDELTRIDFDMVIPDGFIEEIRD